MNLSQTKTNLPKPLLRRKLLKSKRNSPLSRQSKNQWLKLRKLPKLRQLRNPSNLSKKKLSEKEEKIDQAA